MSPKCSLGKALQTERRHFERTGALGPQELRFSTGFGIRWKEGFGQKPKTRRKRRAEKFDKAMTCHDLTRV